MKENLPAETPSSPPGFSPAQWTRMVFYAFLLAAGILRFGDLGGKSLWVDEACGLIWNQDSIEQINQRCRETHTAPLREYYLHAVWRWPRVSIEAASRLPSAIGGTLFVPLLFLLGRQLFGLSAALFAAFFALAHPWLILHSQDNRMHMLTSLAAVLILGLLWRLLRENRSLLGWAALGAILAVFGWFTFLSGMVFLAVAGLMIVEGVMRLAQKERRPELRRLLAGGAVAASVFFLLYAPMLPVALQVSRRYLATRPVPSPQPPPAYFDEGPPKSAMPPEARQEPPPASHSEPLFPYQAPYETRLSFAYAKDLLFKFGGWCPIAAVTAFCLALLALLALAAKRRCEIWIPVFWFLAPLPILWFTDAGHFFPPRYLLYAMPVYALLVGWGAAVVFDPLRRMLLKITGNRPVPAALLAGTLVMTPILASHARGLIHYYTAEKQNWRDAMQYIETYAQDGDTILVGDHWAIYGIEMYRNPRLKKQLHILPDVLSAESFAEAVLSTDNIWYIYWAKQPPYIRWITYSSMEELKVFPGLLGNVRVLRKKSYPSLLPSGGAS